MWAAVAPAWAEHAVYADTRGAAITAKLLQLSNEAERAADSRGAAITAKLLQLSAPRPGERVLELACGAGGVGIAAAELVGPAGEVVLSDVAKGVYQCTRYASAIELQRVDGSQP